MQKVCLIIPCYNESKRLPVREISDFANRHSYVRMILVNDGSKDNTTEVLNQLAALHPQQIEVLDNKVNAGKAEAVRSGILKGIEQYTDIDYFGYWDADLSTPLEELEWYKHISGGELHHKMIIGSRVSRLGAAIQRKMMRHYLGRIFSTVASKMLKLAVYDTQCGAKLIHKDFIQTAFAIPFKSKWLFDVEILARLTKAFGSETVKTEVLEVPLRVWKDIKGSKLHLADILKIPMELWRIKSFYKL